MSVDEKSDARSAIKWALDELAKWENCQTDGIWLEHLTVQVAPHIRAWNIDECWPWTEWPQRQEVLGESTPRTDVGIDVVARTYDGHWVAIQCKSRQLDDYGAGAAVKSGELDKFLGTSSNRAVWSERWLVVNGAVGLGGYSQEKIEMSGAPVKTVNIAEEAREQYQAFTSATDVQPCPHCETLDYATDFGADATASEKPIQSRSCMQRQAVETAVARLRANELADEEDIPKGEARGRIILPCGTGKTRIALRIVEELTFEKDFSVVLCPSIALVAQLRREFLQHTNKNLRALAVCSDKGVAADGTEEEKIANKDDTFADRGMATKEEIRGCPVTTDPAEIADWIKDRHDPGSDLNVIFGTYQSARRISEAIKLADAGNAFKVLICDEAHRTAGVRRKKLAAAAEEKLREFTLCHDREAFPATYRVYQTATPKIYSENATTALAQNKRKAEFVIRDMDDQSTFGMELFRRSYADAVRNDWLSDYRIIAMAVGGEEATAIANQLVTEADQQAEAEDFFGTQRSQRAAKKLPITGDYLKGMAFALVMGGAAQTASGERVPIKSCIGFLNTIARSKAMTTVLQSDSVSSWVAKQAGQPAPEYRLEHLDASAQVAKRDEAKRHLATATSDVPHGVLNVGIFGEGTDSPSLSAVAFLEPRKSPIDVVQAVGRAMRRAEGKALGYIIVPVVIPLGVDAEEHLAISGKHEGWRELGEILQALRAHDQRIEDALPDMLQIQLPPDPQRNVPLKTVVALGRPGRTKLEYAVVTGSRDDAEDLARAAVKDQKPLLDYPDVEPFDEETWEEMQQQPSALIVHAERPDGSKITREDSVVNHKPTTTQDDLTLKINVDRTKRRAPKVLGGESGRDRPTPEQRAAQKAEHEQRKQEAFEGHVQQQLLDLRETLLGQDITMNLLEKSGLSSNTTQRDLNVLADAVHEAARYLHAETNLAAELDQHFGIDNLAAVKQGKTRADGSTTAALLWMNAAMLQQRIHSGGWLSRERIAALSDIKASTYPEDEFRESWSAITDWDFLPAIRPAREVLVQAIRTGRLGGLRRALRHLAAEAERVADVYAEMGSDHAGALFNQVMGDQSSDGAFFTRPVAADIAARLALDALDPNNSRDWTDPDEWRKVKTVDLACGSGTLLTAVMTEMKRRATQRGVNTQQLADLQKVAVEEVLVGLDVNQVSIQLAATQLMTGNKATRYQKMRLHLMPYGPQPDRSVAAGTLELFGRSEIVNSQRLFDDTAQPTRIKTGAEVGGLEGPEMERAVDAVRNAKIVIMNPPFTNRSKMGEKFGSQAQKRLRSRMDTLEGCLQNADPHLSKFLDKNTLRPRFAALAELCLNRDEGVFTTVIPTIALTNTSGLPERLELAKRFHIHTIVTCHNPSEINLSQNTNINESILVMSRAPSAPPPPPPDLSTRVVALDRFPSDDTEVDQLFKVLKECEVGVLSDGWGEVFLWPKERIEKGDWTAAIWRSSELAEAAAQFNTHRALTRIDGGGGQSSQDAAHSQRQIPPEQQASTEPLIVHTTLQTLYSNYRLVAHANEDVV